MRFSNETVQRVQWQERALCGTKDPELFFPDTKPDQDVKNGCLFDCEVRGECLAFALETNAVGMWGGTSTKERRKIKAESRRVGSAAAS